MRNKFDSELQLLNEKLIDMGVMCEKAIACAVKALLEHDIALAESADEAEREIDRMERDIESLCLKLILQQQPVARDLRQISAALKMITDMERIGDQAADIAELTEYVCISPDSGTVGTEHITAMAEATVEMVTNCIDSFVNKDVRLAESVIAHDDVVDALFLKIKNDIVCNIVNDVKTSSADPDSMNEEKLDEDIIKNSESAIDLIMIAKYLERIGDHAVNVAEWVLFSITGIHPN